MNIRGMAALMAMGTAFTSAAVADLQEIHDRLLSMYTRVAQPHDEPANHSGNEPFTGDCDDYYTAAWNQMLHAGHRPYALLSRVRGTGKLHIVACADVEERRRCLDPNSKQVSSAGDLLGRYYDFEARSPWRE